MTHSEFFNWCVERRCEAIINLDRVQVDHGKVVLDEWIYTIRVNPANAVVDVPSVTIESVSCPEAMEMAVAAMGRLL